MQHSTVAFNIYLVNIMSPFNPIRPEDIPLGSRTSVNNKARYFKLGWGVLLNVGGLTIVNVYTKAGTDGDSRRSREYV